jgi:hypothetical protein
MIKFEEIFDDIFNEKAVKRMKSERLKETKESRVAVYIVIGKLGLRQGKQKILGVYPTADQANERQNKCIKDHDTLFRRYMVAQVYVSADGVDCDLEF